MTDLRLTIVALSGSIGSGKTTTANLVAQHTGWAVSSYGNAVRAVAERDDADADRTQLQRIGARLIAAGWDSFTRIVLNQAAWKPGSPVIVEGVRHCGAVTALKQITAPMPVRLIYLDLPVDIGIARASQRDGTSFEQCRDGASHRLEQDLHLVRALADLVVPIAGREPGTVADRIVSYLVEHASAGEKPGGPGA